MVISLIDVIKDRFTFMIVMNDNLKKIKPLIEIVIYFKSNYSKNAFIKTF